MIIALRVNEVPAFAGMNGFIVKTNQEFPHPLAPKCREGKGNSVLGGELEQLP